MRAISFNKANIGGLLKISKQHYKWRFELHGTPITIEVLSSKLSGRRRVYKDGVQIYERQIFDGSFTYTFSLGQHMITLAENGEHFELRVDNVSFNHMLA